MSTNAGICMEQQMKNKAQKSSNPNRNTSSKPIKFSFLWQSYQNTRFSQQCHRRFRSSGMWCCVNGWVIPEISKDHTCIDCSSIIRNKQITIRHNFIKYLTFRGPCIVTYSYNKSQRDAQFLKFIWQSTLHVLDRSTVHHQEYINTVYTPTELAWWWWWTVDSSKTCRVLCQINLRNSASCWLLL